MGNIDVVVVGNVGIDTNVYIDGGDVDLSREANFTQNIDCVGQAGGYASRGYARLGKRTSFIGCVGDDFSGRFIREEFVHDGIDMRGVFLDPAGTSRSINFMYQDGRRKNFYDGKSHMTLQPDLDACRLLLSEARLAHFNIPNWARHLLPAAKQSGMTIACDIQDVVNVRDGYRDDFIEYADIVFFSAANLPSPAPVIEELLRLKPDLIIVSGMGADGCAVGTHASIRYFPPVSMTAPVIDTNGAGDSLAVGFLSSYVLDGYSLEEAIRRGQIAARYCCTQRASSSYLITPEMLAMFYQQD